MTYKFIILALSFNVLVTPSTCVAGSWLPYHMQKKHTPLVKPAPSVKPAPPDGFMSRMWSPIAGFGSSVRSSVRNKVWAPIASFGSSVSSRYFDKSVTYEGLNKTTALCDIAKVVAIGLVAKHAKDYWELDAIDKKIGASETANTSGEDFLFGSWKCNDGGDITSFYIYQNEKLVRKALLVEAKRDSSPIHILDDSGTRIGFGQVKRENVSKALQDERRKLVKWLDKISCYTDAPEKIAELVLESRSNKKIDFGSTWYQEKAFHLDCIKYFKDLGAVALNQFGEELIALKCNSYRKCLFFGKVGLDRRMSRSWRLCNWYGKASKLYWKVYTRYLRTCALYDVMSENDSDADNKSAKLQKLLDLVQEMIRNQDNAYNDYGLKTAQICRLQGVIDMLANVKDKYRKDQGITGKLDLISVKLTSINSFLHDNKAKPVNDTATSDLNGIADIIEQEKRSH